MIQGTFRHLQGVGAATERRLWEQGLTDWDTAAQSDLVLPRLGPLAPWAERSRAAWEARDWPFFSSLLTGGLTWRWFRALRERAVYLDIETTGLSPDRDVVTVVACYDGTEVTLFVRDDNLHEFPQYLLDRDLLVTYNGASFDVPFLKSVWPALQVPPVHLDLRYPLRALGYKGGLKGIEQATGLGRDSELLSVDGYMAVLLWRQHQRGDARALPTLLRYAAEDVLGLEPLAELVFNQMTAALPWSVEGIEPGGRRAVDLPWWPEVVAELAGG